MQKSKAHTLTGIILLLAAILIFLRPSFEPASKDISRTSPERPERPKIRLDHAVVQPPSLQRDRETGEIVWQVGKPTPTRPVIRGKNNARRFGDPVLRELPENIEGSTPSVLAMTPADGRLELLPEEVDVHTLESRRMVFDPTALERVIRGETNHILAPTPGNEVLDLKIERIRTRSSQTYTLTGKIAGEEASTAQIVYHDGIIKGTVSRYDKNQHFEYRTLEDNHMMVRELDVANMNGKCGDPNAGLVAADIANEPHSCGPECTHEDETITINEDPKSSPEIAYGTEGWTTVDIVVGYGAQARTSQGGASAMETHIIDAVDRMNEALLNSEVTNTEVMLLGTIEDPAYSFPGGDSANLGSADELGDLYDISDDSLDTVTDYAFSLGADLISFVVDDSQGPNAQSQVAGVAQRPGRYSVVARTYMDNVNFTFCHELGHNFGARHSWNDGGETTNSSRYGVRFEGSDNNLYRTIMAYNSQTYISSRVPHFSNPDVPYLGTPTGLVDGADLTITNDFYDPVYEGGYVGNGSLGARNAQMFLVEEGGNGVTYAASRANRSSFAVTSPLAGDLWPAGSTQTISFTGVDMDYTADIDLYKGGILQYNIANDIAALDQSFEWSIPPGQQGDNDYQIRVTLTHTGTMATNHVESDFFVIQNNGGIVLESPIGGENWTRNTVRKISWSSAYGTTVNIEYIKGANAPVTIVAGASDNGSYDWTIPHDLTLGSDYIIRVTSNESPFESSESAGNFSIVESSSLIYSNSLDSNPGFTTTGTFEYGSPGGINGAGSPYTGTTMYDTDLDDSPWVGGTLTSTPIDCSNHANVNLEFYAHYSLSPNYTAVIEVSTNNSTWTEIFSQTQLATNAWNLYSYDISSVADGQPTVYIRWSMVGSGQPFVGGGMAIDDISLTGDFIPSDGFKLLKPDGGQSLATTAAYTITWLSNLSDNAKIELIKNGSVHSTITNNTANDGSYYWIPPDTLALDSDYKIRISSVVDGSKQDESSSNFTIAAPSNIIFSSNLDTDPGFARTGSFDYGTLGGDNLPDAPHTGTNAYDTEINDVDYGNSGRIPGTLTSIAINCSNHQNVNLQFWSHIFITVYYEVEIEISTDNSAWHNLDTLPGEITDTSWVERNYDISSWADGSPTVYIRWSLTNPTSYYSQYIGGGLSIDDITISGDFFPSSPTYESWSASTPSTNDSNGDGIANSLAWVLGAASPTVDARPLLPTFGKTADPDIMTFNYRRSDAANTDGNTSIAVLYSADLSTWTTAVDNDSTINIFQDNDHYGPGVDRVRVEFNRSLGPDGKLFSRLQADVSE